MARRTQPVPLVFLVDVDNTLLDNDALIADLMRHLEHVYGASTRERYQQILEQVRSELGYVDYLGALQRYRVEHEDEEPSLLPMSSFLVDYPFHERLFPQALAVLEHLARSGRTVILSDGDVAFQPRKVQRSGIWDAVEGRVLIYIHKERMLPAVERHYPAQRYVLIDDKIRILDTVKRAWRERVTTILPRQGHYAHDADEMAAHPPADLTIERIGELLTRSF
jgi:FMN phosphatase YigB (HAD superfamily)